MIKVKALAYDKYGYVEKPMLINLDDVSTITEPNSDDCYRYGAKSVITFKDGEKLFCKDSYYDLEKIAIKDGE